MARRWSMLVLAVCLLAPASGCLDGRHEDAVVDRTEEIDAGAFLEVNLRMNESAELSYRWNTSPTTELAFDVHSHPSSGEVAYHEQGNATEAEGTFTAPEAGTYSLLWENRSEDAVTLQVRVSGDIELDSIVP